MEWLMGLSPVIQGLVATIFTWAITALGACLVFFFKTVDKKIKLLEHEGVDISKLFVPAKRKGN